MIEIEDKLVSDEIFTECFACDITKCKGLCCVEGDAGAPLEMEEVDILEEEYDNYKQYMTEEGRKSIDKQGFFVVDIDGEYTTPLINNSSCAFAYQENGVTLCAIEKAFRKGECSFQKPISCHLYPIRLINLSNGTIGLNFHRWNICSSACENGCKLNLPLYKAVKEAIIRRFGEQFYQALECAENYLKNRKE